MWYDKCDTHNTEDILSSVTGVRLDSVDYNLLTTIVGKQITNINILF